MPELGHFTRAQRVLAVLLPYYQRSDDWTVPKILTQAGIGEVLDLPVQSVSKALRWLEDNDLVTTRQCYIEGSNHKRITAYFPTWEGIQYMKMVETASGFKAREIPTIPAKRTTQKIHFNDPLRTEMEKLEARIETEGVSSHA